MSEHNRAERVITQSSFMKLKEQGKGYTGGRGKLWWKALGIWGGLKHV